MGKEISFELTVGMEVYGWEALCSVSECSKGLFFVSVTIILWLFQFSCRSVSVVGTMSPPSSTAEDIYVMHVTIIIIIKNILITKVSCMSLIYIVCSFKFNDT